MVRGLPMVIAVATIASPVLADTPPFPRVYGCFGPYYCMGDQFGLIDGGTYSTFNGGRGRYSQDPAAKT